MPALEIKKELRHFIENSDDASILKFYEIFKAYISQNKSDLSTKKDDFNNEKTVAYKTNGNPLTKEQYIKHIHSISDSIKNGANTNTTKEVKDFILNKLKS